MKNNIKIFLVILVAIASIFSFAGCSDNVAKSGDNTGNNENTNNTESIKNSASMLNADRIMADGSYQIRFSDLVSLEDLKEYNNKTVTAIGYLSPIASYDRSFGYLMNLPYQTCP